MGVSYNRKFTEFSTIVSKDIKKHMVEYGESIHFEATKGTPTTEKSIALNPQITGRLKASWRLNTTGAFTDVGEGDYRSNTVMKLKVPPLSSIKDKLYLTNGVPYASFVETGVNPLHPNSEAVRLHKKFLKRAIMRAEIKMAGER